MYIENRPSRENAGQKYQVLAKRREDKNENKNKRHRKVVFFVTFPLGEFEKVLTTYPSTHKNKTQTISPKKAAPGVLAALAKHCLKKKKQQPCLEHIIS